MMSTSSTWKRRNANTLSWIKIANASTTLHPDVVIYDSKTEMEAATTQQPAAT